MKNNLDLFIVLILLIIESFFLGSGFGVITNGFAYISLVILLPRLLLFVFPIPKLFILILLFAFLTAVTLTSNSSIHNITLEITFAIRLLILIIVLNSDLSFNPLQLKTLKILLVISIASMLIQCLFTYFTQGNGMLLRGDRNHSAVIITSAFLLYYVIFSEKLRLSFVFVITNFSRNLVIGLIILFFDKLLPLKSMVRLKYLYFFSIVFFLNSIFYFYGWALENYFTGEVGSSNDLSRLLVVFDGSNNLRFNLNYEFLTLIGSDILAYLVYTGDYSGLKEILGLYPHNSFLHLLYRVGIIRCFIVISLLVYFVRSKKAALVLTIFFFQAAFIHEMFLNSLIILLSFMIAISNHKDSYNE